MSAELIDAANELVEQNIQIALANRRTFSNAVSATHCTDCGDELDQGAGKRCRDARCALTAWLSRNYWLSKGG